jgi:tetratricopeptide (TPR) repeat protein
MDNILKKIFIYGSWPYAIIGSILILSSTYILGVITFSKEQKLLVIQKNLAANISKMQESQQYYDIANIQIRLAVLQNSILKNNLQKSESAQEKNRESYVRSLFAELVRLAVAAGDLYFDKAQIEKLNQLVTKAIEGDDSSLKEINNQISELLLMSDKYKKKLKIEQGTIEKNENDLKQSIIKWKNWATIMQIVGLFFLLAKEIPDYLWGNKKNNKKGITNSST